MPKPKRGRLIKKTEGWRGSCPVCNRTGVKLLWAKSDSDNKLKTCKICGD